MHWKGLNQRQGDSKEAAAWSSEKESRSEEEQWPQDGSEWQILEAQQKISGPAINFI